MHRISPSPSSSRSAGFTLVEMLVIAPIIVLVLSTFIALMINMTGDVLASAARNKLTYETSQALNVLDRDIQRSVLFPEVSFTPLAPQGYNTSIIDVTNNDRFNGGDAFHTGYGVLILRQVATDKSPYDPARKIIYTKNSDGSCSTNPYLYDIVYFFTTKNIGINPSTGEQAFNYRFWRRILFDKNTQPCTGQVPWQKPTCAAGQTGANCKTNDEEWGSDQYTVYGASWYYANIPDATLNIYVNPDWIHPYYDNTPNCTGTNPPPADPDDQVKECRNHIYDPYSPTTGKNATSIYFLLGTAQLVAGDPVTSTQYLYSTRHGSL